MLALAPSAPPRRFPVTELVLSGGLWILVAGIAVDEEVLQLAGAAGVIGAVAGFVWRMAPLLARRRLPLEAPLAHMAAGAAFLVQAAILGVAVAANEVSPQRALGAYVVLLLVGFAGGVTLGHLGKLLSLSIWVWWPPGPRPKQDALYPRRLWLLETAAFAAGVELLALGALAGTGWLARAGAVLLVLAAVLGIAGRREPGRTDPARRSTLRRCESNRDRMWARRLGRRAAAARRRAGTSRSATRTRTRSGGSASSGPAASWSVTAWTCSCFARRGSRTPTPS